MKDIFARAAEARAERERREAAEVEERRREQAALVQQKIKADEEKHLLAIRDEERRRISEQKLPKLVQEAQKPIESLLDAVNEVFADGKGQKSKIIQLASSNSALVRCQLKWDDSKQPYDVYFSGTAPPDIFKRSHELVLTVEEKPTGEKTIQIGGTPQEICGIQQLYHEGLSGDKINLCIQGDLEDQTLDQIGQAIEEYIRDGKTLRNTDVTPKLDRVQRLQAQLNQMTKTRYT